MYGSVLGQGSQSIILANGDKAQKIFPAGYPIELVESEAEAQSVALAHGIRAPKVYAITQIENRPMLVMERIPGISMDAFMRRNPSALPSLMDQFSRLQAQIHEIPFEGHSRLSDRVRARIMSLKLDTGKQLGLLANLRQLPEDVCMCHGDFHPQNIIVSGGALVVLDWADACIGNALADVCQTFLILMLHAPQLSEIYKAFWDKKYAGKDYSLTDWLTPLAFARSALHRPDEPALVSLLDSNSKGDQ